MKGVLLINTGSPITKRRKDVKSFVGAMLSDPMVMTVPNWFRPILVHGMILPLRQFSSTAHYSLIWDDEHDVSPLFYHMKRLAFKLEKEAEIPVEVAMRYEEPSIQTALDRLKARGEINEVIVLPLFPHYAESSTGTVIKEVKRCHEGGKYPFQLRFIDPYFNDPEYIHALAKSIKPYLEKDYDRIIFTYHSLPLSHVDKAREKGKEFDYVFQTKETTKLVVNELELLHNKVRQVYSSAMGSSWLEPSLDDIVKQMGEKGMKRVVVVSAGFSVDNLETLYDVGVKAKEIFQKAGGGELEMIPCLNSSEEWIKAIIKIIW